MLTRISFCSIIFTIAVLTTHAERECQDLEDCANQVISLDISGPVFCNGELSCINATFISGNISDIRYVYCDGSHSCKNAVMDNVRGVDLDGAFSFENGIVHVRNRSFSMIMHGYYGAYNATITCEESSSCRFYCYGYGCANLYNISIICDNTSSCNFEANENEQNYINYPNLPDYYHNYQIIEPSSGRFSDDFLNRTDENIYCTTFGECANSNHTINFKSINNIYNNKNKTIKNIYCVAQSSCSNMTLIVIGTYLPTIANENASLTIYCTGKYACENIRVMVINETMHINITMVCLGHGSCLDGNVTGVSQIYIGGSRGLVGGIISSDNQDVTLYSGSYNAMLFTVLYCNYGDECDVFCDSYDSCKSSTVYCYGNNCDINCFTGFGDCPDRYDYTLSPTNNPSYPTNLPTQLPTTWTFMPTQTPIGSESASGGDGDARLLAVIETWTVGGYVVLFSSLIIPIILTIIACIYHKNDDFNGCDKPNYFALFLAFWVFGDFWTDLSFCMILWFGNHYLAPYATAFLLIPHLASNIITLVNISKWQHLSVYLSKYISRYDYLLIVVSCFGGFYAAIELARSNIFYLNMFSLHLKRDDYRNVQQYRFLNTVLSELGNVYYQLCFVFWFDFFVITNEKKHKK